MRSHCVCQPQVGLFLASCVGGHYDVIDFFNLCSKTLLSSASIWTKGAPHTKAETTGHDSGTAEAVRWDWRAQ